VSEDFTTYTEVDENADISVDDASQITVTSMNLYADSRVYDDKGASHFGDTFSHTFKWGKSTGNGAAAYGTFWAAANTIADMQTWFASDHQAVFMFTYETSETVRIYDGEHNVDDTTGVCDVGETHWFTVERTAANAIQCRIYSDEARTSLVDTISIALTGERAYRYLYAVNSRNNDASASSVTFVLEDLDLNEAAAGTIVPHMMHLTAA